MLAIGVFVAGVVQLVAQFPALRALGLLPRPRFDRAHEGVRRIGRLMLPGIFGSSVAQVSLLLDTIIASFLVVGSVTWLYYADRLVEFPMGVFSIALATVILPGLSSHHSEKSPEKFNATLDWALRSRSRSWYRPPVGLLMLSGPLMATFFGYGAFTDHHVLMSSYALMAYSFGLVGFSLVKVLAPGYFARQDTKTPVRIGVIALTFNMAFNVCVVVPAFLYGFPGSARAARGFDGPFGTHQRDAALSWAAPRRDLPTDAGMAKAAAPDRARESRHGGFPLVDLGRLGGLGRLVRDAQARRWLGPLRRRRGGGLFRRAGPRWNAPARPEASIIAKHDSRSGRAMLIRRGFKPCRDADPGRAVAIGNFDGVHLGHQAILAVLRQGGRELRLPTAVVCFEPLPKEFFAQASPPARLMRLSRQGGAHRGGGRRRAARAALRREARGTRSRRFR